MEGEDVADTDEADNDEAVVVVAVVDVDTVSSVKLPNLTRRIQCDKDFGGGVKGEELEGPAKTNDKSNQGNKK
jgi:hypothetical protein